MAARPATRRKVEAGLAGTARRALTATAAALVLAGCIDIGVEQPRPAAVASPSTVASRTTETGAPTGAATPSPDRLAEIRSHRSVREPVTVAPPAQIEIPDIGVSSGLQRLGRDPTGAIEVPHAWGQAGWYAPGVKPGQVGPAVILGHVDSRKGPAVFFRLRELERGDEVFVTRDDGARLRFVVDRVERHAKTRFPTDDVYLPTLQPTLRLVTCDGTFDRTTGHYRDNLVVFADLVDP